MAIALTIFTLLAGMFGVRMYIQTAYAKPKLEFDFGKINKNGVTYLFFKLRNCFITDGWLYQLKIQRNSVKVLRVNFGLTRFSSEEVFSPVAAPIDKGDGNHSLEIALDPSNHFYEVCIVYINHGNKMAYANIKHTHLVPGEYVADIHIDADGKSYREKRRFIVKDSSPWGVWGMSVN